MKISVCRFEWKPQDLWIGVFWRNVKCLTDEGEKTLATDIWICAVPCVPLRITVVWAVFIDMQREPLK